MSKEYTNVGQLPENPLEMPPPYWRSPGIIFQLTNSLEELCNLLKDLPETNSKARESLKEYFQRKPDQDSFDPEFGIICAPLWLLEFKIKTKSELAIFMAAIEVEDKLNQVITYNLHKDITDSIQSLSPPEKLLIISAVLTRKSIKGLCEYEAIKRLTKWRNSYAHGHCTDRPTKSLRHNHLIVPDEYPSVPGAIKSMVRQLKGYLKLSNFLCEISLNEYTKARSAHDSEIETKLNIIERYHFSYATSSHVYDVEYEQ